VLSSTSFFAMKNLARAQTTTVALLLAAVFVLSHPYIGIRHDGILYLGEALVDLDPARMAHDLFFLFGSQASFSVVPRLYSQAIQWMGIGDATRCLLAVSLGASFCAAYWVLHKLTRGDLFAWSMLCVFVGAPVYGGERVFAYSEPFFTARSLAEPLVLLGIGFLVRDRVLFAVVSMLVAVFAHPLIALPGLILCGAWLVVEDRRWLWGLLLAFVPVGLGLAGIAPFPDLFQRYDSTWMAVVQEVNSFVFPLNWSAGDWGTVFFDVAVLGWLVRAGWAARGASWQLAFAALVCGVSGICMSIVGADLLSDVLLTGLQTWRTQWLMHWTAMALAPTLMLHLWRSGSHNGRSAALCVLASILCLTSFGPIFLMSGAALLIYFERRAPVGKTIPAAMAALCIALGALLAYRQIAALTAFIGLLGGSIPVQVSRPLSITVVIVLILFAGLRYLPRLRALGIVLPAVLLAVVVAGWDQREEWTVYQEDYSAKRDLLWKDTVRADDSVYWYREVRAPWLMMHHANYFSPNQASGVLFNRRTAIELDARSKTTGLLDLQETICRMMNNLNKTETACEPDIVVVKDICTNVDHLSFVVLQSLLPVKPANELRTGFIQHGFATTFYLYRCSDIMAS